MSNVPALPIFDRLCRIAENHYPALLSALDRAHLFKFPHRPHEMLPATFDADEIELIRDHFFLPFSTVAVEDPATCVVMWDMEPQAQGWYAQRCFIECVPLDGDPADFVHSGGLDADILTDIRKQGADADVCHVTVGSVQGQGDVTSSSFYISGQLGVVFMAAPRTGFVGKVLTGTELHKSGISKLALGNIAVALQEVAYFNSPNRFILERKQRKHSKVKHGKTARSFNRSVFTMMTPREIRAKLGLGTDTKSTTAPHARRRHFRTYRDDRYVKMQGKTVLIPASWVGPHATVMDGDSYVVRLDL